MSSDITLIFKKRTLRGNVYHDLSQTYISGKQKRLSNKKRNFTRRW